MAWRGLVAALILAACGSAQAQDGQRLSELSPDGADACFGRAYDAAHLARNPDQKVQRIYFLYGRDPVGLPSEEAPAELTGYNGFLAATVRGAKKPEWVGGWCSHSGDGTPGAISCGMECDRHLADLRVDAKGSLKLTGLERHLFLDLDQDQEPDSAKSAPLYLGRGDDNFRLDRKPMSECLAEFGRINATDPALGLPLRQRLKSDQPFCFGRTYDAAHLAAHPEQVTTSIHLSRNATQVASYAVTESAQSWPDGVIFTVSAETKAGAASRDYICQGEGDQWSCGARPAPGDTCDVSGREIYLRRGRDGAIMIANPNNGAPIIDLCSAKAGQKTNTDDRVYRLGSLPQAACGG